MSTATRDIRRKRQILEYAEQIGNIRKACRQVGIPRSLFYVWRKRHAREGDAGLINRRPCARLCPHATPPEVVEQLVHVRRTSHPGPVRIVWYLAQYHGIWVSYANVSRTLRRHRLQRLPNRVGRPAVPTHRDEKHVPGHHVHMDVKCLSWLGPGGRCLRRDQYTAIDDVTRVRTLRVYWFTRNGITKIATYLSEC